MDTQWGTRAGVTWFVLDFLKLAVYTITLRNQRSGKNRKTYSHNCIDGADSQLDAACKSHLNRVLRPGPQVELQEAQVDQELQAQLFSPAQVRLVQVSSPSAQLQLLQST